MSKIMKFVVKAFIPSSEKIAQNSAKLIQTKFNGTAQERKELVSKYATITTDISETIKKISEMLEDGEISDLDALEIEAMLLPFIEKAREVMLK